MKLARLQLFIGCLSLCGALSPSATAATIPSPVGSGLVVPAAQLLDGDEQVVAAVQAHRASPEAVQTRVASQTKFRNLSASQAIAVARRAFPSLIDEFEGTPRLAPGEEIRGYSSDHSAEVGLPENKRAVLETLEPIALETAPDQYRALDLHLRATSASYTPERALVSALIPKQLAQGFTLPNIGLSLTPVESNGHPLTGGPGEPSGASIIYHETSLATDTLAKATPRGFSADTLLRSTDSPRTLYFKLAVPAGAYLSWEPGDSGLRVLANGTPLATIPRPTAIDAEGTPVPLSVTMLPDNIMQLSLPANLAPYDLPIAVDPTIEDWIFEVKQPKAESPLPEWHFVDNGGNFAASTYPEKEIWLETISPYHTASEYGGLFYTTQGASQIVRTEVIGYWDDPLELKIQDYLELETAKGIEDYNPLPPIVEQGEQTFVSACEPALNCTNTHAGTAPPENGNTAVYLQEASAAGTKKGSEGVNRLFDALVLITQTGGPEVSFNTTSETIHNPTTGENVPNVLYGSGSWLSPHHGAFEVHGKDPGVGLDTFTVAYPGGWNDDKAYKADGDCKGVQCPENINEGSPMPGSIGYTYEGKMPDGVNSLWSEAMDSVFITSKQALATLKVDGTPPGHLKVTGLVAGSSLPMGEAHLKVEASDGEGTTPSSGVKSITVLVDGKEVTGSGGSCSEGPCTAAKEITLISRDFKTGEHTMVITATDNADNVAQEEFLFFVKGAPPVTVGPAEIDGSTGEMRLANTDVPLGGTVDLTRTFRSRELTSGLDGPFGPQWSMTLGGGENLTLLADGSAVVDASGAQTTFRRIGSKFFPPAGDSELSLASAEEGGKGISEYILTDNATGTHSRFIQPAGLQNAAPTFSRAFGEGAGLTHAQGVAVDASGNIWVTSYETDQIEKFSPGGVLLGTYGSKGTALGQFEGPWGLAISPVSGDIYVSDLGNNRVVAMSPTGAFLRTFGRNVGEGAEAESCAKNCHAGESGSQLGAMTDPAGIAVGPASTVFVVDSGNNRIEEFSEAGHVKGTYGSAGSGADQLNSPRYIALQGEYAFVADAGNERVDEFTPGGAFVRAFGWGVSNGEAKLEACTSSCKAGIAGSGTGQFNEPIGIGIAPSSGNVYVGDFKNSRIEEFSETGTYLNTFGSSGKGLGQLEEPKGLAVNGSGAVYVADYALGRVSDWSRPTWYAAELGGPLAADATTYTYTTVEAEGKTIVVPAAALAPVPAGVSCATKVEKGCRELTFEYANTTTATGEAKSAWGSYKGRLASVWFHAWEPGNPGKVLEKAVADYSYDSQGRLRAEWDPRLASPLKTTYGYDSEGHVTAESAPNQQPWIFNYGTAEGDAAAGRVISVLRPSASTAISDTEVPTITTEPKMSTTTPVVGEAVTVTNGSWTNSALSFAYQWETCTAQQETWSCEAIPGADNPSYTPLSRDRHKRLQVTVSATNAAGTTQICAAKYAGTCAAATAPEIGGTAELNEEPIPTPPVSETSAVWTIEYHVPATGAGAPYNLSSTETARWGQTDNPVEGTALFPPDEPMGWPAAHYTSATVKYYDKEGRSVNTVLPGGGVATTEYNTANNVTRELTAANREQALKEGSKSAEVSKLLDTESRYSGETAEEEAIEESEVRNGKRAAIEPGTEVLERKGPRHLVKLAEGGSEVQARSITHYTYDEGSPSGKHYGLVTKTTVGAEYEGHEADVRATKDRYTELGWTLRKPTSTTVDPNGLNLTTGTEYSPTTGKPIETISPGGVPPTLTYAGSLGKQGLARGELWNPNSAAIDESGNVWVVNEHGDDVVEFSATGTELNAYGEIGHAETKLQFDEPTGIAFNKTTGQFYVADAENDRVVVMSATGGFVKAFGAAGTGAGQMKEARGVAFDPSNNVWVADHANNRVDEFSEGGTFVTAVGWGVSNGESKLETCTTSCRAGLAGTGAGQLNGPSAITFLDNNMYVTDTGNNRVEEYNGSDAFVETIGSSGTGKGQFTEPTGISAGGGLLYVTDRGNDRVEQFSPSGYPGEVIGSDGTGAGQLSSPSGLVFRGSGQIFVVDTGNGRVEKWETGRNFYIKNTVYYTTEANATYPACGGHPEWAGLLCMNVPPQPEAPGLPSLPTTTITYNVWDEPETTVETFAASKRTKTETYDAAGRALTSETTVSPSHDTALPKVTQEYNTTTGALEKTSTTAEGKTKTVTRVQNSLGQLVSYTDAEGATTKYSYDIDGRLEEVSDPKGSQSYVYDPTTGDLVKLVDSAAGTFTASYGPEGNLRSETYPNGMTANVGEASDGQPTTLEYVKTTHCTEKCTWFTQTLTPTIHGETAVQTTSLGTERYTYDTAGRLTQTQEEVGGKCTVRLYEYDSESQRTALVTRQPGVEGKCATEGGSAQTHVYDPSGRLLDAGVTYEEFGNMTTLPTADAGKYALTDTYYVDSQVDTQVESGLTTTYHYDPLGRTAEAKTGGNNPIVYHYDGEGEGAAWFTEGSTWTRDIAGIGGSLVGVQSSSGSTVLQLRDLQGDIVATAGLSEAETKLLSTYNSTEFGVPQAGTTPPKYAWQGARAVVTGLATGAANGDGSEYVPLLGTTLQTQAIARPGAFPNDNTVLPTVQGAYIAEDAGLLKQLSEQRQSEEEAAARKHDEELLAAACEENPLACPEQESNDPGWVWHLSIQDAAAIASAIYGGEFYEASQTTVVDFLKQFLGIDFIHQIEEAFIKDVVGFSREDVEAWGFDFAEGLQLCVFESAGFLTATCWVYVTTEEKFFGWKNSPLGAIGVKYELPMFSVAPEIAFCPYGESNCYRVY